MPFTDLPFDQLVAFRASTEPPADFDEFWETTLEQSLSADDVHFELIDSGLTLVETYDVTWAGYAGAPIRGWLHVPRGSAPGTLPGVVQYLGFSTGRGLPHEDTTWAQAGYAQLIMDTRGHGAKLTESHTTDPDPAAGQPGVGRMTSGIGNRADFAYRRIFVDAVRAIGAIRAHPLVDPKRILVSGKSQGGGIALAAAALVEDEAIGALIDVPFLSCFPRAIGLASLGPYLEVQQYLKVYRDRADQVLETLSYFDAVNFAGRVTVPALFSVALMDPVCPPSTVYAAYNSYAGPKSIKVYPYNEHEGGGAHHVVEQLRWVRDLLGLPR
jgi:cephalosporin-C deacetylase